MGDSKGLDDELVNVATSGGVFLIAEKVSDLT